MITKFYFQKAKYIVSDENGNQLLLENNYELKTFKIRQIKKANKSILLFRHNLKKIAAELLDKKHAVNFAYKFRLYYR